LFAEAGRRQNEDSIGCAALSHFRDDDCRLNRLAEAHFVGEQHAAAESAKHGESRLELMRHNLDAGVKNGAQASRRSVAGDERACGAAPQRRADPAEAAATFDRFDGVERCEDLTLDARLRRC
jgi:hypothetical protein